MRARGRSARYALVAAMWVVTTHVAWAGGLRIELPARLSIAQPFGIGAEVVACAGEHDLSVVPRQRLGDAELLTITQHPGRHNGRCTVFRWTLSAVIWHPGPAQVGPLEVVGVQADGRAVRLTASAARVRVDDVLLEKDAVLRPPRAKPAPSGWSPVAWLLAGLALGIAVWQRLIPMGRFVRVRRCEGDPGVALARLQLRQTIRTLRERPAATDSERRSLYQALRLSVRSAAAQIYGLPGRSFTTESLLRLAAFRRVPGVELDRLGVVLRAVDGVLYAGKCPTGSERLALLDEADRILSDVRAPQHVGEEP